jgi:hypothetical protein
MTLETEMFHGTDSTRHHGQWQWPDFLFTGMVLLSLLGLLYEFSHR